MRAFLFLFAFGLALNACGNSPLLNHKDAGDSGPTPTAAVVSADATCPLSFSKLKMCAQVLNWQGVTGSEEKTFVVKFWTQGDSPDKNLTEPPGTVTVKLWMPAMGHGSSPVKVQKLQPGIRQISQAYFVMPGDWEIQIKITHDKVVLDQAVAAFRMQE